MASRKLWHSIAAGQRSVLHLLVPSHKLVLPAYAVLGFAGSLDLGLGGQLFPLVAFRRLPGNPVPNKDPRLYLGQIPIPERQYRASKHRRQRTWPRIGPMARDDAVLNPIIHEAFFQQHEFMVALVAQVRCGCFGHFNWPRRNKTYIYTRFPSWQNSPLVATACQSLLV